MPALQLVTVDPPPPPANLPADLPGLTAAIAANLAEEARINEQAREEEQKLFRTYEQAEREIDQRRTAAVRPVRLERGRLLLAARELVPAGQWETWCAENIKQSPSDIRAVIKLAKAADPNAAVSAERAATRARVAKHRAAKAASAVTEIVTAVPEAEGPSDVFAQTKELAAKYGGGRGPAETRWWKVPGLLEAEPRNAEEVRVQYAALGWHEQEAMRPIWAYDYNGARGDKLEEAQKFFPTKAAWKTWIKAEIKSCPATTEEANAALNFSKKARAARDEIVAARETTLRSEFPEFAERVAAGDHGALELIWAAQDIWEAGWRAKWKATHPTEPEPTEETDPALLPAAAD